MVSLAKNATLLDYYRRLSTTAIMGRIISRTVPDYNPASEEVVADHRQIVEAYEQGDLALARSVIIRHTEGAKRVNRRAIEASGGQV